ncbi:MAG: tagatose 1,6-diphosphate aldolase [Anaerolineaceae bacterium]|nr:tagatose 1,6-diphosphate aldolase [Anaerolineaceae bacterium]
MQNLSIGKIRALQRCTSARGTFTCLALDHRQNLRRALNPENVDLVTDQDLSDFKLEVTSLLAEKATAVLLDPQYSAAQAISKSVVPRNTGLVVAVESTGYGGEPTARQSQILPGWSIKKAKHMGADMIKLLVYYHPDSPTAGEIEDFVKKVAAECVQEDLGLMLEPLSYTLDLQNKALDSAEKRYVVVETARRLVVPGVDVLKAEFPLDPTVDQDEATWAEACAEISAASPAPWILLSAAVDYELFLRQVIVACQAGASGIAVGRAVWKESVQMKGEQRKNFLQYTALQRLIRLTALCTALAKPWQDFYSMPSIDSQWYSQYGE